MKPPPKPLHTAGQNPPALPATATMLAQPYRDEQTARTVGYECDGWLYSPTRHPIRAATKKQQTDQ
jgi:hypothetical protein